MMFVPDAFGIEINAVEVEAVRPESGQRNLQIASFGALSFQSAFDLWFAAWDRVGQGNKIEIVDIRRSGQHQGKTALSLR